jgi:hypothetical protein
MSEPVSNAEIEDVLSSIRRLVSNDVSESQEAVADEPAAKLILTADFRVPELDDVPSEEAEVSEAEAPDAGDDTPFEFHHTERATDEDTQTAQAEPDQEDTNEVWQDPAEQAEDVAQVEEDTTPSLESTIADLEAAIGQQDGEWEPDGSDFEEDADAEEVMSEPVQDWIDGTAQEVDAKAAADDAFKDEAEDADLFGSEESVIDEETLRDMVSDIVRQELQGALGERITRNVRKLVRREINRVLAAQDFE